MIKKAVLAVVAFCVGSQCGVHAEDTGDIVTRTVDLEGFTEIELSGVYAIDISIAPDFSIELSGPSEEMSRVQTSLSKGRLRLRQQPRAVVEEFDPSQESVKAVITLPVLQFLKVSGVVNGKITKIESEQLRVGLSGVGDISLRGRCGRLTADVSGVGNLNARRLKCSDATVSVSGVGDARVFASQSVDAKVSGIGDIDVYGSPKQVTQNSSFLADITIH